MTTFTVNTTDDIVDGNLSQLSLREAVNLANATTEADTIVFAGALEGQTLVLTGGELTLSQDVTIDGDQNNDGIEVALSGGDSSRILRSSGSGTDLALQDLTLTDGRVGGGAQGGGVFVGGGGSLALADCTVRDCRSGEARVSYPGNGGGIFAEGGSRVIVAGSRIEGNRRAARRSRGRDSRHGRAMSRCVVRGSQFADNDAGLYGIGRRDPRRRQQFTGDRGQLPRRQPRLFRGRTGDLRQHGDDRPIHHLGQHCQLLRRHPDLQQQRDAQRQHDRRQQRQPILRRDRGLWRRADRAQRHDHGQQQPQWR